MDVLSTFKNDLASASAFLGLYLVLILAAKWAKDLFTSYSLNKELGESDNFAIALTMGGYYLAITLVYIALLRGPSTDLQSDLLNVAGYSVLSIVLLNLSRWVNDKLILRSFCNIERLTRDHDSGVGAVQFGVYTATGLIASGAISGEGQLITFVVFFALGQLVLIAASLIYQLLSPFNLHAEMDRRNVSAGVGFSGYLLALGLIVMNGVSGDFTNWKDDLFAFGLTALAGLVLLPLIQILMDRLIIPGKSLRKEIAEDKNIGAGFLEASVAVCIALVLIQLL